MDATDDRRLVTLEDRFARFAEESAPTSPLYARLAGWLGGDARPAAALANAPPGQVRPTLWLAGLHAALLRDPSDPLAAWYPSCGGTRHPDEPDLLRAFKAAVDRHAAWLEEVCRTRATQTNEVGRTVALRLGLAAVRAAGDDAVSLVEIGPSAGLLLRVDRYAHVYGDARAVGPSAGPPAPDLTVACDLRGDATPAPTDPVPTLVDRVGLDPEPGDPADPEVALWLRACLWPEHDVRRTRLDAALAAAARDPAPIVAGDAATEDLETLLGSRPAGLPVVVWHSSALAYLARPVRAGMGDRLAAVAAARGRDVWQVSLEGDFLAPWDAAHAGVPPEPDGWIGHVLGLARHRPDGTSEARLLARVEPHGRWVRWLDLPA
ncbi:MAG: DUF2332 domain-containing protein [Actinomycetes bacterium]